MIFKPTVIATLFVLAVPIGAAADDNRGLRQVQQRYLEDDGGNGGEGHDVFDVLEGWLLNNAVLV